MSMYNKLFTKIVDSSIWLEPSPTRIVWLTFIAVMDEDGFVQFASIANVAHRARVTLEEAEIAIKCLEEQDLNSSDPDNNGKRVERVPGGWMVLNASKHREMVTRLIIKEQTRERVRRFREKKRNCNADVTPSDTETDSISDTNKTSLSSKLDLNTLAREILTFLNEKSGRNYKPVEANLKLIVDRLKEGYEPRELRQVIALMSRKWKGDSKMDEFLRPKTLFNKTNFANYSGELKDV